MIGSLALYQLEMESLGREHELVSPGMGKHKLKSPAKLVASLVGWQMPKRLPWAAAASITQTFHFN